MGRVLNSDPLPNSGRPGNPQPWNRYAYGGNNPMGRIDPAGLYEFKSTCGSSDKPCNAAFAQTQTNECSAPESRLGPSPLTLRAYPQIVAPVSRPAVLAASKPSGAMSAGLETRTTAARESGATESAIYGYALRPGRRLRFCLRGFA